MNDPAERDEPIEHGNNLPPARLTGDEDERVGWKPLTIPFDDDEWGDADDNLT